ncbi:MAG: glycosyltransferase [Euryarchaeota archaeon TMED85]|nr:MAG: glycosyltransferase [Euryarchaeota archaeon TMED85]
MGRTIQRLHNNPPTNWDSDVVVSHADGGIRSIIMAWNRAKREFVQKIKEKPDLIHVHTATRFSWYRKRKIIQRASKQKIPTIVHLHSGAFEKFGKGWIGRDISRILNLDYVYPVTLTEYWKEWLEKKLRKEVKVVPNPYRRGLIPTSTKQRDIKMLLLVGRPSSVKGHSLAINAVQQLREEGHDIYLHLVGTNEQDLHPKLRNKNGIIAEGWVEDSELDKLMNKAGFLLMPSEHEGMPLSLIDALASGLPAIVSKACSSFINQGGIVVSERNIQTWKQEIKKQMKDKEGWKIMSKNSRNDVSELDSESDKKRWETIYNEIIEINS